MSTECCFFVFFVQRSRCMYAWVCVYVCVVASPAPLRSSLLEEEKIKE